YFIHNLIFVFFFFQAEDGIRDFHVTGVQTCALPISAWERQLWSVRPSTRCACGSIQDEWMLLASRRTMSLRQFNSRTSRHLWAKIGRASCRERVERAEIEQLILDKKQNM